MVGSEVNFDPSSGYVARTTWRGSPSQCTAYHASLVASGIRAVLTSRGGVGEVSVLSQGNPDAVGAEVPVDKWEIGTEFMQVPIWGHPNLANYANGYDGATSIAEGIARIRQDMELALKGKTLNSEGKVESEVGPAPTAPSDVTAEFGSNGELLKIYKNLCRGQDAYPITVPVLSRVRTYSAALLTVSKTTGRMKVPDLPIAYRTATLISTYAVPVVMQTQMPDTPATVPEDAEWAWQERRHTLEVNWVGKVTEVQDWVFGAHSTVIYTIT